MSEFNSENMCEGQKKMCDSDYVLNKKLKRSKYVLNMVDSKKIVQELV